MVPAISSSAVIMFAMTSLLVLMLVRLRRQRNHQQCYKDNRFHHSPLLVSSSAVHWCMLE